jgi:hypothetical protein
MKQIYGIVSAFGGGDFIHDAVYLIIDSRQVVYHLDVAYSRFLLAGLASSASPETGKSGVFGLVCASAKNKQVVAGRMDLYDVPGAGNRTVSAAGAFVFVD